MGITKTLLEQVLMKKMGMLDIDNLSEKDLKRLMSEMNRQGLSDKNEDEIDEAELRKVLKGMDSFDEPTPQSKKNVVLKAVLKKVGKGSAKGLWWVIKKILKGFWNLIKADGKQY